MTRTGEELERIELYGEYAPAQLKLVKVDLDELEFTFWSEDRLILRFLDKKRRVLIAPAGEDYANRLLARHLVLE